MDSLRARLDLILALLVGWPRRALAGLCLLGALVSAVGGAHHARSPAPAGSAPLVIAARALSPGAQLSAADLRQVWWPPADLPASAITRIDQAIGHRVGAPMSRGEPLTLPRMLDTSITVGLKAGQAATTVTLADPGEAAILQPGAMIDLYPAGTGQVLVDGNSVGSPIPGQLPVTGVMVLAILEKPVESAQTLGPTVIVGADHRAIDQLAAHVSSSFLATLITPP